MDWMFVFPPNPQYVEALISKLIVFVLIYEPLGDEI